MNEQQLLQQLSDPCCETFLYAIPITYKGTLLSLSAALNAASSDVRTAQLNAGKEPGVGLAVPAATWPAFSSNRWVVSATDGPFTKPGVLYKAEISSIYGLELFSDFGIIPTFLPGVDLTVFPLW